MSEFARESILHALVAAFVFTALARTWRVEHPHVRVRFGLLAVAVPVVLGPVLRVAAPGRTSEAFREGLAIFDSARWNDIRVLGAGLADVAVVALGAIGVVLLARDLVPWLHDWFSERPRALARDDARVHDAFARLAARMGVAAAQLVVLDEEATVLHCQGARRVAVVISRGACHALDDAELDGALAHEIAHVERRDPALGWALMLARVAFWFNPAVQVLARVVTQELERRADDRAAEVTGDRVALASALLKVFRATEGAHPMPRSPVPGLDSGGRAVSRYRAAALELRCRRLLDLEPPERPPRPLAHAQMLLGALGVGALLFFVV